MRHFLMILLQQMKAILTDLQIKTLQLIFMKLIKKSL